MRAGTVEEGAVELLLWFENLDILGASTLARWRAVFRPTHTKSETTVVK